MTLLDQHCQQVPADAPRPRQHLMALFRPWAGSEAPVEEENNSCHSDSEGAPAKAAANSRTSTAKPRLPSSPPVGICAGLATRGAAVSSSATLRRGSLSVTPSSPTSSAASSSSSRHSRQQPPQRSSASSVSSSSSTSEPILTRLEGLVANLDESSQSSRSSSRSSRSSSSSRSGSGSCPPSPTPRAGPGSGRAAACDMSLYPVPTAMLSPEEVALLAAQQQALHEEALLTMAGLHPAGPASYLDEYARLLQQEHKAAGVAARKQRPKKYRCPHCQVAFSNNGQLRGHVRIHTGERPFKCEEESCGKRFTRNEELTRHKRIHSGLRPFACQACGKRFGRKDHLKKHTRTHDPAHAAHRMVAHLLPHPALPLPLHPAYLYGF